MGKGKKTKKKAHTQGEGITERFIKPKRCKRCKGKDTLMVDNVCFSCFIKERERQYKEGEQ
jgi:hypothetical protein